MLTREKESVIIPTVEPNGWKNFEKSIDRQKTL